MDTPTILKAIEETGDLELLRRVWDAAEERFWEVHDAQGDKCTDCHGSGNTIGDEAYQCDGCGGTGEGATQRRRSELVDQGEDPDLAHEEEEDADA